MNGRIKGQEGMTLVEILVVIAVIATLVVIAAPLLMSSYTKTKVMRTVREVATELSGARTLALSRNRLYRVEFTLGSTDSYKRSWSNNATTWNEDTTFLARTIDSNVNISSPGSSFNVIFRPNSTSDANHTICLEGADSGANPTSVTVYATTGRVAISGGC